LTATPSLFVPLASSIPLVFTNGRMSVTSRPHHEYAKYNVTEDVRRNLQCSVHGHLASSQCTVRTLCESTTMTPRILPLSDASSTRLLFLLPLQHRWRPDSPTLPSCRAHHTVVGIHPTSGVTCGERHWQQPRPGRGKGCILPGYGKRPKAHEVSVEHARTHVLREAEQ
jgi:hypothetical protein